MPDKDRLEHEVARAAQARQVLDHPLWVEAWEAIYGRCLADWEHSAADQVQLREDAWKTLYIAKKLRRSFERVVETGKLAEQTLEGDRHG